MSQGSTTEVYVHPSRRGHKVFGVSGGYRWDAQVDGYTSTQMDIAMPKSLNTHT